MTKGLDWKGRSVAVEVATAAPSRLRWTDLPEHVRVAAEREAGAPVVRDVPQTGGFSPGLASRLTFGNGRRVFAKAINAARNPDRMRADRHKRAVGEQE